MQTLFDIVIAYQRDCCFDKVARIYMANFEEELFAYADSELAKKAGKEPAGNNESQDRNADTINFNLGKVKARIKIGSRKETNYRETIESFYLILQGMDAYVKSISAKQFMQAVDSKAAMDMLSSCHTRYSLEKKTLADIKPVLKEDEKLDKDNLYKILVDRIVAPIELNLENMMLYQEAARFLSNNEQELDSLKTEMNDEFVENSYQPAKSANRLIIMEKPQNVVQYEKLYTAVQNLIQTKESITIKELMNFIQQKKKEYVQERLGNISTSPLALPNAM